MVGKGTWLGRLKRSYILLALCKEFRMMNHTARMYMSQFKGCTFPPKDIILKKKKHTHSQKKKVGKSTPRLHTLSSFSVCKLVGKGRAEVPVCVRGYICILVYTKINKYLCCDWTNTMCFLFLSFLLTFLRRGGWNEWYTLFQLARHGNARQSDNVNAFISTLNCQCKEGSTGL